VPLPLPLPCVLSFCYKQCPALPCLILFDFILYLFYLAFDFIVNIAPFTPNPFFFILTISFRLVPEIIMKRFLKGLLKEKKRLGWKYNKNNSNKSMLCGQLSIPVGTGTLHLMSDPQLEKHC
jgi:hypothetical protein